GPCAGRDDRPRWHATARTSERARRLVRGCRGSHRARPRTSQARTRCSRLPARCALLRGVGERLRHVCHLERQGLLPLDLDEAAVLEARERGLVVLLFLDGQDGLAQGPCVVRCGAVQGGPMPLRRAAGTTDMSAVMNCVSWPPV